MSVELASTTGKVNDIKKVRLILESYCFDGVDIQVDDIGHLLLSTDGNDFSLPLAVKADRLPNEEEDDPDLEDHNIKMWFKTMCEEGDEEFLAFLRELAPYLETPLMILAVENENGDAVAQIWRAQPGSETVETMFVVA